MNENIDRNTDLPSEETDRLQDHEHPLIKFPDTNAYKTLSADWLVQRIQDVQEFLACFINEDGQLTQDEHDLYEYLYKAKAYNDILKLFNQLADNVLKKEYDIYFKYVGGGLTDEQIKFYEQLTGETPKIVKVGNVEKSVDLTSSTAQLRKNYELNCNVLDSQRLFDFLYQGDYIAEGTSDPEVFNKIFKLEAVHPRDRIIWTDYKKESWSLRSLVALFRPRIICKKKNRGMAIFLTSYFRRYNGELDKASINTISSRILDELETDNQRENDLMDKAQRYVPLIKSVKELKELQCKLR